MRIWKTDEIVTFRYEDGSRGSGTVLDFYLDAEGVVESYEVWREDGQQYRIAASEIIDWEQVSADASAALQRIADENQRRANLLYQLLGALSYFVDNEGEVIYRHATRWESGKLADLVSRYQAAAADNTALSAHPDSNFECHCGYPKRDEAHDHWVKI